MPHDRVEAALDPGVEGLLRGACHRRAPVRDRSQLAVADQVGLGLVRGVVAGNTPPGVDRDAGHRQVPAHPEPAVAGGRGVAQAERGRHALPAPGQVDRVGDPRVAVVVARGGSTRPTPADGSPPLRSLMLVGLSDTFSGWSGTVTVAAIMSVKWLDRLSTLSVAWSRFVRVQRDPLGLRRVVVVDLHVLLGQSGRDLGGVERHRDVQVVLERHVWGEPVAVRGAGRDDGHPGVQRRQVDAHSDSAVIVTASDRGLAAPHGRRRPAGSRSSHPDWRWCRSAAAAS